MKNVSVKNQATKKVNVKESKIDLLQLSESIKSASKSKRNIEKDKMYIFKDSEIEKAQIKLNSFKEKYKGKKDLTNQEKRNLKLSKHLSSERSKIRNQFESLIVTYFKAIEENKLNLSQQKELANNIFLDFFKERFVKFEEGKKIYSDMFCNSGNSLEKKINSLCEIMNK